MLSSVGKVLRRTGAAAAIVTTILVVAATPASAHGAASDDAPASNYRSVVTATPDLDGVAVRTVEAGSQLEVVNTGDDEVVVLDYDGRPYLRIRADGVLENQNSPAVYLNQSRDASVLPPEGIGNGPPDWTRVSGEPSYRWHDHRAHWMGGDPPLVTARPDQRQTVAEWVVPLRVGERRVEVEGVTEWVPAPTPLPWIVLAGVLAAAVVALAVRRRVALAILVTTVAIGASSAAIAIGAWQSTAEAALGKLPMLALPTLILTLLVAALFVARSRPTDALTLGAVPGATAAITLLLTSGDWLTRSQLPTELPANLARASVAVSIGTGLGLSVAAAWVVARPLLQPAGRGQDPAPVTDVRGAETGTDDTAGVDTEEPSDAPAGHAPELREASQMRRTLLVGVVLVLVGVAVTAQLTGNEVATSEDDEAGVGAICRAIASAPDDGGSALRVAFAGPAHDALHDLAARAQVADRALAADLLRAKQKIEASLTDEDATLDPGPALPVAIRRTSVALDTAAPDDCTLEPS